MSELHEAAQEQELVIRETVTLLRETAAELRCACHEAYTGRGLHEPNALCYLAAPIRVQADKLERVCGLGWNAKPKPLVKRAQRKRAPTKSEIKKARALLDAVIAREMERE